VRYIMKGVSRSKHVWRVEHYGEGERRELGEKDIRYSFFPLIKGFLTRAGGGVQSLDKDQSLR